MKVLVLGGTGEGRELAGRLRLEGVEVVSSLAGRTTDARLPVGEVRQGGFGGALGLTRWLRDNSVDVMVDATHPFAATMTEHAVAAARSAGIPLLILRRPGWTAEAGDEWHWVDTAEAAARLLPTLGSRAFLTIGRQGLHTFADAGVWMLARCVDPPEPAPTWCTLILDRGPYDVPGELALMRHHHIDVLVTKDSGGPQTSAKLTAARQLSIPVVLIRRPPLPLPLEPTEVESVGVRAVRDEAVDAEPKGVGAMDVEPVGVGAVEVEPVEVELVGIEAAESGAAGVGQADDEPVDAGAVGVGAVHAEPVGVEPVDAEAMGVGPVDAEAMGVEPSDAGAANAGLANAGLAEVEVVRGEQVEVGAVEVVVVESVDRVVGWVRGRR